MTEEQLAKDQLFADLEKDGIHLDADIIHNAKKGNGDALWSIGYEYDIEQKQYDKAMQWYRLGAAKNHAHALNNMGMLYHNGQGVVKSYLDALEHWIRSAKKNNVLSMLNIGNLFNNGQGVPLDTIKAQQWYHINDVGIDKDKLLKRLIKETEAILHAEREKPHADQSSDQPSDPPHSLIKQQYNDDLPVYSNEDSGLKQDVKPPKVLNQTNKQKNNTMLYEIDQLKQANHHQKERLKAKDATIKSLKNQINTIQTDGEPTKEMMELYKSLVHSQNNEIKLIKENMKLRLKKKRRSKRKLKKALEKYKAKLE